MSRSVGTNDGVGGYDRSGAGVDRGRSGSCPGTYTGTIWPRSRTACDRCSRSRSATGRARACIAGSRADSGPARDRNRLRKPVSAPVARPTIARVTARWRNDRVVNDGEPVWASGIGAGLGRGKGTETYDSC